MDSIQPQTHELKLTAISHLKLTVKLLMLIFTGIIYFLRYNTLTRVADHNNDFYLTGTQ